MSQTFFTVDQVADRLGLHPKTVLRLIAAERLRATKIGKSYRILRSDLDAFAGVSPEKSVRPVRVTSIVDMPDASRDQAARVTAALQAALISRGASSTPVHLETAFDPAASHLKLVIIAEPADTAALLQAFDTFRDASA